MGVGPFMRTAGMDDHHCLFMIQTPPHMQGCEHFTFHMGSGTEVLLAGTRFQQNGWTSFWGPGRHLLGSNWFWYFNSPLGGYPVNLQASLELLNQLRNPNWPPVLVYASSVMVYGGELPARMDEGQPALPQLSYAAHKRRVEIALLDLSRTWMRPGTMRQ